MAETPGKAALSKRRLVPHASFLIAPVFLAVILVASAIALPVIAQQIEPTPLPLYALPDPRVNAVFNSGSMALSGDGRIIVAANMLNNTMSIVQIQRSEVLAEIPVGKDPRSVALTPDDSRALVVNRGDGTLTVIDVNKLQAVATYPVGVLPYGVVTDNKNTAYVSLQGSGEVVQIDLNKGKILARIPVPGSPTGLALWGDFLYVTHLWSGQLSLIYLPQQQVVRTIDTGMDVSLVQFILIDPAHSIAYLPASRSNAQNRLLTYDTTIFPMVNVANLSRLDLQRSARITLDTADRPVNMPFAAALDGTRRWLYVAEAGSNSVSVIDLVSGLGRAHVDVGANPRGILLNHDGSFAYVHNMLDGTISVIDTRAFKVSDVIPISDLKIPVDVLIGAQFFNSAADPRLSQSSWISCASCHFDGQSDGRTWQGIDGGRNTPALYDLADTAPYNWDGSWSKLSDVELKIRGLMAGRGLIDQSSLTPADIHSGVSLDLDTLTAYLGTLTEAANPNTKDRVLIERGKTIFQAQKCASCHSENEGIDGQQHDVGTGGKFDTPTLRWLWQSAPYLHDGSAPTLKDLFAKPGAHQLIHRLTSEEIDALVTYLLSL